MFSFAGGGYRFQEVKRVGPRESDLSQCLLDDKAAAMMGLAHSPTSSISAIVVYITMQGSSLVHEIAPLPYTPILGAGSSDVRI